MNDQSVSPPAALSIEVVSDVVCPWCYVGKRRLEGALALYAKARPDAPAPTVAWLPFQLNPQLPAEGMARADYVAAKWGGRSSADVYARVSAVGETVGIAFRFDRIVRQPNTLAAHSLIELAGAHGVQSEVKEALLAAYFLDGRDLTDAQTLVDVVAAAGLDAVVARAHLADPAARHAVEAGDVEARQLGVQGVPFFIFNRRYAVSGAEESAMLLQAMLESEAPAPVAHDAAAERIGG
ncbi:MAG: DsbA family oxidoreductase [Proteobacteria bacterium]|nr:DsbA family oxidoreductase [Burkholderiales bacterium]